LLLRNPRYPGQVGKPDKKQWRLADIGLVASQRRQATFSISILNGDDTPDLEARGRGSGLCGSDQSLDRALGQRLTSERTNASVVEQLIDCVAPRLERPNVWCAVAGG
jgi:hypothetical protein